MFVKVFSIPPNSTVKKVGFMSPTLWEDNAGSTTIPWLGIAQTFQTNVCYACIVYKKLKIWILILCKAIEQENSYLITSN